MNLMKMIGAILLLIPVCALSQEQKTDLVYFVGKETKEIKLAERASFNLQLSQLIAAPYIQVAYNNSDYAVDGYTIAILSKESGEVIGPFKYQQGSLVENAARMKHKLSAGDRIFIEDLTAFCPKCEEQRITTKGMAILVE